MGTQVTSISGAERTDVLPFRLVAVDMDGTFLDSDGRYDRARFERVHARLRAAHVEFVVASGNQYWQLRGFFEGVQDVWYVAENGCLVGSRDEVLRISPLNPDAAAAAQALLAGVPGVVTLVCCESAALALRSADEALLASIAPYYTSLRLVDGWDDVTEPVLKLALACEPEATAGLVRVLENGLPPDAVVVSSGHGSADIIPASVNKVRRWPGSASGSVSACRRWSPSAMAATTWRCSPASASG